MQELDCQLWFHELPISNEIKAGILDNNISQKEFYHLNSSDYLKFGINLVKSDEIANSKNLEKYASIGEYLTDNKIRFIAYNNKEFPQMLKMIYNPCTGIFVKGTLPTFENSIAIVGARNASEYGRTVALKMASQLSSLGICIISGMARGIDSCAHNGALQGRTPTVAVMGSGFKNIYPRENLGLSKKIAENGCVITEYMPDCMPLPFHFPLRNRIISALAKYVLVVEAGDRSGSLTTASLAQSQGKDVFAIPGSIYNPKSIGTNKLIRDGAKIITELEDIIEEFPVLKAALDMTTGCKINSQNSSFDANRLPAASKSNDTFHTGSIETQILHLLKNGAATIDTMNDQLKIKIDRLLSILNYMECDGLIKRGYGKYYLSL